MVVRTCTTSRCAPCLCFASVNQRHEDDEPPRPCGVRLGVLTACGVVMLVKPASPLRCSPRPWRVRLEKLRYSPDTDSAAVLPAKVVRTRTEALQIRSAVWEKPSAPRLRPPQQPGELWPSRGYLQQRGHAQVPVAALDATRHHHLSALDTPWPSLCLRPVARSCFTTPLHASAMVCGIGQCFARWKSERRRAGCGSRLAGASWLDKDTQFGTLQDMHATANYITPHCMKYTASQSQAPLVSMYRFAPCGFMQRDVMQNAFAGSGLSVVGIPRSLLRPTCRPLPPLWLTIGHGIFLCSASVALRLSRRCGCCSPPPTHFSRASRFGLLVALPPPHGGSLYRRPSVVCHSVQHATYLRVIGVNRRCAAIPADAGMVCVLTQGLHIQQPRAHDSVPLCARTVHASCSPSRA